MFVRMTRVESSPDELDAAIAHYRDQVASQVKNLPGYLGAALHADRATLGTRQSLMMWDNEETLRSSEQTAERLRGQVGSTGGSRVMDVDRLEVLLQERSGPFKPGAFLRNVDMQGSPDQIDAMVQYIRDQVAPVPTRQTRVPGGGHDSQPTGRTARGLARFGTALPNARPASPHCGSFDRKPGRSRARRK